MGFLKGIFDLFMGLINVIVRTLSGGSANNIGELFSNLFGGIFGGDTTQASTNAPAAPQQTQTTPAPRTNTTAQHAALDVMSTGKKLINSDGEQSKVLLDVGHAGRIQDHEGNILTHEQAQKIKFKDLVSKESELGPRKYMPVTKDFDPGAVYAGTDEYKTNIFQAYLTKDKLEAEGFEVMIYTNGQDKAGTTLTKVLGHA